MSLKVNTLAWKSSQVYYAVCSTSAVYLPILRVNLTMSIWIFELFLKYKGVVYKS
jgi:hypothetical protein